MQSLRRKLLVSCSSSTDDLKLRAGARVLRQDPVECLFEFICSSNHHISRIHGMVERLCRDYGTPMLPHSSPSSADGKASEAFATAPETVAEQVTDASMSTTSAAHQHAKLSCDLTR